MKLKWAILALCAAAALMAQRIPVTARGTVHRADSGTTATLPAARLLESGQYMEVMCASASSCTVGSAGGLIDGGFSFTVASGITVRFVSDGASWFTAGGVPKANSDGTISAVGANASGYYVVSRSASAPTNGVNLGALTSGVVKIGVSGGVATPAVVSGSASDCVKVDGSSGSCGTDLNTGSGTVTSVGLSLPAILSVSGSPVTTSGTISATLATQSANLVFAGPASGASATPTFRSLTADDLPPVSTENPYEPNLSGWTSSGTETVTEATHGRGGYAWGACYADNTTLMEAVACKVEHSKTTGDLSFTYTTKPFRVRIYRGDKAQGPAGATGATGATGAAGALNLVGIDGTSQTTRARINLKTGSDMTITAADNAGTNSVDVTIGATATGIKNCNDASGSGTTYTCPSAGASSLTDLVVMFKPQTTSSGAATVNVSSLGAKSILRQSGNSVISGELRAGERYLLKYNGTAFVMDGEYLENTDGKLDIGRGTHPRTINVTAGVFAEITGANDLTGANSFSQRVRLIPMAYASLPTCVSGIRGAIAAITDSNTVTWGATAAGGGSDYAQVNCNGMNWTVTGK